MHTRKEQMEAFGRFLDILDELREKCPWDRKQTNESLRPNTIEETYELCDALIRDDKNDICKELGDVLLHVAFYAKIGSETGDFDMKDVCDRLCEKLIFRHPHVFGDVKAETAGQVSENWEQLKLKEKDGNKTVLSGVPAALPSLIKAYRIQDKARNVGFDWEEREQVWDKVKEEIFSGNDQLSDWLRENQACFIQKNMSDIEVINAYSRIIQNVADNPRYSEAAKEEFARVADSWICAHALAHKYVVVTEETYDPNSKKRVKIPNICKDYEIEYIDMIRFFREIEVKIL